MGDPRPKAIHLGGGPPWRLGFDDRVLHRGSGRERPDLRVIIEKRDAELVRPAPCHPGPEPSIQPGDLHVELVVNDRDVLEHDPRAVAV